MTGDFTDLRIWQKAHELTLRVYKLTFHFPSEEKYGLISQLRRAAVSVEANIAESHGRYHYADVVNFLLDARGSIFEVQDELMVTRDVNYCRKEEAEELILEYSILAKQVNRYISFKRTKKEVK